jgi:O-antigen/teichoic acid export membrane protein
MDEKLKNLFNNTIIYGIGNFGSRILSFLLLPLYSYYLNKSEFGEYDLIITIITLVVPFFTLQFSDSVFRWLINFDLEKTNKVSIFTNGIVVLVCSLIFTIIFLVILNFFFKSTHFVSFGILLLLTMTYNFFQQSSRGFGYNKIFAFSGIFYSICLLISTYICLVLLDLGINGLFISSIISNSFSLLFLMYFSSILKHVDLNMFNINELKEMLRYSVPLIPNSISWWVVNSANKFLILYFLGVEYNGIFGMISRIPGVLIMINSIFMLSWQESAIKNFHDKENNDFYSKIFLYFFSFQIIVSSILSLMSEFIVVNFFAPDYHNSWKYMPFLFFGVAFSAISAFFGTFYLSNKNTGSALFSSFTSGIINVLVCFSLIKVIQLQSVSIALFISYFFLFIFRYFHLKNILGILIDFRSFLFLAIVAIVCLYFSFTDYTIFKYLLVFFLVLILIYKVYYRIKNLII